MKTPLIYSTSIDASCMPAIVTGTADMMAIKADSVHILKEFSWPCDVQV